MNSNRKIRKATYLDDFKCVGGVCEDNCCTGWNVEIDQKTFGKYMKLDDPGLAELAEKYVYKNEDCYDPNVDYGLVELKENMNCPFLNDSKLCSIQARLGEDYLSNVCATYPRLANEVNGVVEYSATISCPEVARLVLGAKEGLRFQEDQENINKRNIISITVDTKEKEEIPAVKYLLDLRNFTISILQLREYYLWERILILGFLFQEIQNDIDKKKGIHVLKIINSFEDSLKKNGFKEKISTLKKDEEKQLKILKRITDQLNNSREIDSKEYLDFIQEYLSGVGASGEVDFDQLSHNYNSAYREFYLPFMKDREFMLENYLVNYVFQSLFPVSESINPFDSYQKLVSRYALIKFYLIGIGSNRGNLTEAIVTEFIQVFSKALEHNYLHFEKISAYMMKNNYTTMEYMSILVKN